MTLSFGISFGISFGLNLGISLGTDLGINFRISFGISLGISLGFSLGISLRTNLGIFMNKLKQYEDQCIHEAGISLSNQLRIQIDGDPWNYLILRLWNDLIDQFASQLINGIANDYQ